MKIKLTSPESKHHFLTDVNTKPQCPIHKFGYEPKKIHFIPIKDKTGVKQNKFLRVVEDGYIHKLITENGGDLHNCHFIFD